MSSININRLYFQFPQRTVCFFFLSLSPCFVLQCVFWIRCMQSMHLGGAGAPLCELNYCLYCYWAAIALRVDSNTTEEWEWSRISSLELNIAMRCPTLTLACRAQLISLRRTTQFQPSNCNFHCCSNDLVDSRKIVCNASLQPIHNRSNAFSFLSSEKISKGNIYFYIP